MATAKKLTFRQAAEAAGLTEATFRNYVSTGRAPTHDGLADPCGCKYWLPKTIAKYTRDRVSKPGPRPVASQS